MKKHKFKFEVSFSLNLKDKETLDKQSIKQFERHLYDFANNWAGNEGCFYIYASDYDGEAIPTNLKVKKIKA